MTDDDETPVVFRVYGKREGSDVIALFPAEAFSEDGYTCSCYLHVGQHGEADPRAVINRTKPATPEQYSDLKLELESEPYGYRLRIYKRLQRRFVADRQKQIQIMKEARR